VSGLTDNRYTGSDLRNLLIWQHKIAE